MAPRYLSSKESYDAAAEVALAAAEVALDAAFVSLVAAFDALVAAAAADVAAAVELPRIPSTYPFLVSSSAEDGVAVEVEWEILA